MFDLSAPNACGSGKLECDLITRQKEYRDARAIDVIDVCTRKGMKDANLCTQCHFGEH